MEAQGAKGRAAVPGKKRSEAGSAGSLLGWDSRAACWHCAQDSLRPAAANFSQNLRENAGGNISFNIFCSEQNPFAMATRIATEKWKISPSVQPNLSSAFPSSADKDCRGCL